MQYVYICAHRHTHTHVNACGGTLCRYPWNVVFMGIRILSESGEIFDGDYFATNDEGEYIGYQ